MIEWMDRSIDPFDFPPSAIYCKTFNSIDSFHFFLSSLFRLYLKNRIYKKKKIEKTKKKKHLIIEIKKENKYFFQVCTSNKYLLVSYVQVHNKYVNCAHPL